VEIDRTCIRQSRIAARLAADVMGTPTVLGKATGVVAVLFMVTSFALSMMAHRQPSSIMPATGTPASTAPATPTPAAPATPAPATPAPQK